MRRAVLAARIWLLVAVVRDADGGWRRSTGGRSFVDAVDDGLDDGRRWRPPPPAPLDGVPPTMMKLYRDQQTRGGAAAAADSVVRSFRDQGYRRHHSGGYQERF